MSELLSLPLLQEPSFSFLKLIVPVSQHSLFLRDCNCKHHQIEKTKELGDHISTSTAFDSQIQHVLLLFLFHVDQAKL